MKPTSPNLIAATVALALAACTPLMAQLPKIHHFVGAAAFDAFGECVRGAGDVNGDGFADVIVGAPCLDGVGTDSGSATVISGQDGSLLFGFNGDSSFDNFGHSVSGAGDVNGDGFDDVIVGAPKNDAGGPNSGLARVFSGADGSTIYSFSGDSPGDQFGFAVAGTGDANGDGFDDFIVGARLDGNGGPGSGSARLISGIDGAVLHLFDGDSPGDQFGATVAGAGDVDGDGFDDVIVGSSFDDNNGPSSGSASVFSGLDGSTLFQFNGANYFDRLGISVGSVGDIDADGHADLIVGATGEDFNGSGSGSARVFSGEDGIVLFTCHGDSSMDNFGASVSGAGDLNGDGIPDFVVGATQAAGLQLGTGYARAFSGGDGAPLLTLNGDMPGHMFGVSVAGVGDVDGDDIDEIVVGANMFTILGAGPGAATVFSICGSRPYGSGMGGAQTLSLDWSPGPAGFLSVGDGIISGADPHSRGVVAMSSGSDSTHVAGVQILIDLTPRKYMFGLFTFDGAGGADFQLELRQPAVAGRTYFIQAFEANVNSPAGFFASNGLEIIFCR